MNAGPIQAQPGDVVQVHLKVVPGASRAALAGVYGDRLKLRVTAPAESGKANKAVLALLARALDVPVQDLELLRGASAARKTVAVTGLTPQAVARRLGLSGV